MTVLRDMAAGRVTKQQVDAIREVYPAMYQDIVQRVHERLASLKEPLDYSQKVQLSMLLGVPADETMDPHFVQTMQQTFAAPKPSAPQGSGGPKKTQRPIKDVSAEQAELTMGQHTET
jgi:hypothetical protein